MKIENIPIKYELALMNNLTLHPIGVEILWVYCFCQETYRLVYAKLQLRVELVFNILFLIPLQNYTTEEHLLIFEQNDTSSRNL